MKFTIILSILFFISSHPLSMIFILISMTILIAFIMIFTMKNLWFPLILILLILGGMLVLFIYVSSLTPNQKFLSKKWMPLLLLLPMTLHMKNMPHLSFLEKNIHQFNMDKSILLIIFITIYLLITLLAIMKLINSSLSPLRLSN
uniref:NADH dehydrogenase subunit 6 n=1 Tax=Otobius lagophilus TaxID=2944767 RepID=UPI0022372E13|nr:NADH dehydrogenase subunit 6 [Otobius lagophilus]UYB78389.1 NADH dehydrogenase subunit 6 [Otobius lagophilus]UYB78402.1 NADH dehydrogenase subunit 6 [Otobius lagophilus]UYL27142.1 NADH dehydrogenase subunit 6 [Otobius lagophilus]